MEETLLLDRTHKPDTRSLWEKVFTEDSEGFLDFYSEYVLPYNECYGIYGSDGELASMLQLNPYSLDICGRQTASRYIVAVATDAPLRHRGLMRRLLSQSLKDMNLKGIPFAYLMPADEAIYKPFGFSVFYENNMLWASQDEACERLAAAPVAPEDLPGLVTFYNSVLSAFDCATHRDEAYCAKLLAEAKSEGGGILRARDISGNILAAAAYWCGPEPEIFDMLSLPGYTQAAANSMARHFGRRIKICGLPAGSGTAGSYIMGRITDFAAFAGLFNSCGPVTLRIGVRDGIIPENNGIYTWNVSADESTVTKTDGSAAADIEGDISGFFMWLSGRCPLDSLVKNSVLAVADPATMKKAESIRVWRSVLINEVI